MLFKYRHILIGFELITILFVAVGAQGRSAAAAQPKDARALLEKLTQLRSIEGIEAEHRRYRYFPNLIAVHSRDRNRVQVLDKGDLFAAGNAVFLIRNKKLPSQSVKTYTVVQDQQTGGIAYLTGSIKVKVKPGDSVDALTGRFRLNVVSSVKALGLHYLMAREGISIQELLKVIQEIQSVPGVLLAEPVVIRRLAKAL